MIGNKALKIRAITLHGNKVNFYFLSIFELLIYQNDKTHAKHPFFLKNRITLPKTCILSVFDHVTYKTLKYMQRILCLGNEGTFRETCFMSVFKFFKYKKAKTHK